MLREGLISKGIWGAGEVAEEPSEDELSESDEPESEDDPEEVTDGEGDETPTADGSAQNEGQNEYVSLVLLPRLLPCRLRQSNPAELARIFQAICDALPDAIPLCRELSDNVQDIIALGRVVRSICYATYLIDSRFGTLLMKHGVLIRRSFAKTS